MNKLDRLGPDVNYLRGLWKFNRVQTILTELGLNAEPALIEMMAVIAAQERRMINRRTKAAPAAAKAQGIKLGGNPTPSCQRWSEPRHCARCSSGLLVCRIGRGQVAQRTRHQDRDRQGVDRSLSCRAVAQTPDRLNIQAG